MKTIKRFTSIFLAFIFLMSSMSILSQAASEPNRLIETDSFIYYILDFEKKTAGLYSFKDEALGQDGTLTIPNEIDGYKIIYFSYYTFDKLQDPMKLKNSLCPTELNAITVIMKAEMME